MADGGSSDTAISQPVAGWSFGVNVLSGQQGAVLGGAGGRLTYFQLPGVLDFCALVFKSTAALTLAPATPALATASSGITLAALPAAVVGRHSGYAIGTPFVALPAPVACAVELAADGTVSIAAGSRSWQARLDGGSGDLADALVASRVSGAYTVLTGARDLFYMATARQGSGSGPVTEIDLEIAHTSAGSALTYAQVRVRAAGLGAGSSLDVQESCYITP